MSGKVGCQVRPGLVQKMLTNLVLYEMLSYLKLMFIFLKVVENDKLGQTLGDVVDSVHHPGAALARVTSTTLHFKLSQLFEETQIRVYH